MEINQRGMDEVEKSRIEFESDHKDTNISGYYPDRPLTARGRLAYDWIPDATTKLLDGGCSYGYITRYYDKKSHETCGIDLDPKHIKAAVEKYPGIDFSVQSIENTNFESGSFDVIVLSDVLEHTSDKIKALNEIYRLLKPGGHFICTTPHKGLFGFLDPYNYGYYFKKYLPFVYRGVYKLIRLLKEGKIPGTFNPVHDDKHYHYSKKDFIRMFESSDFNSNFEIERVFRSGLFLEPVALNLDTFLGIVFRKKIVDILLTPFNILSRLDYRINYGPLAYNIALKVKKAG